MRNVQMPKFSARIKTLRKERRLKQTDMAELLDCTANHYQQIEYGHVNIPSLMLETLADYFGVSTDYLLGRTDIRETPRGTDSPLPE